MANIDDSFADMWCVSQRAAAGWQHRRSRAGCGLAGLLVQPDGRVLFED